VKQTVEDDFKIFKHMCWYNTTCSESSSITLSVEVSQRKN